MRHYVCGKEGFIEGKWKDGTTNEAAIFPENCTYEDKNFVWRLAINETPNRISELPRHSQYEHLMTVLKGGPEISFGGHHKAISERLMVDRYDGNWYVRTTGKLQYVDLMIKKGEEAYMDVLKTTDEAQEFTLEGEVEKPFRMIAFYVVEGSVNIIAGESVDSITKGQVCYLEFGVGEPVKYSLEGKATVVRMQIFFGQFEEEKVADIEPKQPAIPNEKATFKDFILCLYISNVKTKGAKILSPKKRKIWFDRELSSVTQKLDNSYFSGILFVIYVIAVIWLTAKGDTTDAQKILLLAIGFLAIVLIVNPIVYLFKVPKPVSKHIKKVSELTPYEAMLREQEIEADIREMQSKRPNIFKKPDSYDR